MVKVNPDDTYNLMVCLSYSELHVVYGICLVHSERYAVCSVSFVVRVVGGGLRHFA